MKTFAIGLIRSFKVKVEENQVEKAYAIPIASTNRRIIVVFNSAETKLEVMKAKRLSEDTRKIFFDHRTTAKFGDLLRQVRVFSKSEGGRAFMYGNRVCYQKENGPRVQINSSNEINTQNLIRQ